MDFFQIYFTSKSLKNTSQMYLIWKKTEQIYDWVKSEKNMCHGLAIF